MTEIEGRIYKCNWCGEVHEEEGGLVRISKIDIADEDSYENQHFCNLECLAKWVEEYAISG